MKKLKMIVSLALFLFISVLSDLGSAIARNRTVQPEYVSVGVVVDHGRWAGTMGLSCIQMAVSDFYASKGNNQFKTRLLIHSRDSKSDVIGAASAALDLIKNVEVKAIIGPLTSTQASFVVDLGEKAQVPIIAFSATSSSLNFRSSYFFQATQNQTFQVRAISSIVQAFRWKQVVPVYVDNEYGQGLIPFLADALQDVGARLSYRSVISTNASDDQIAKELYKLMTMQTRVFIVHTDVSLGKRIFAKAKEIGMMEKDYVWITTNVMSNFLNSFGSTVIDTMQGVLGIKTYVPETKALREFRARWKKQYGQENYSKSDDSKELNVYGLWAYDAATALAIAVEDAGKSSNFGFDRANDHGISGSTNNSTDLATLRVSQNGPNLRKALLDLTFDGLIGNFSLANGHLQSSIFEIVNVNGTNKEKRVGFWTPQNGLVKSLETNTGTTRDFTTRPDQLLGQIIWPGRSASIPKGWEFPTNRKKLRIGVPKKEGFEEFVEIKHDLVTNSPIVTGFCIDVFKAVIEELPYSVDYEFIPFTKPDGTSNGTYDELVYQVFLGKYDAVVGDTTIRANRSSYVDFTLPYTESGVSMIVPVRDEQSKNNAWVFLKPLTWDLWVTSFCFFLFIGFVVWVLEHRINEDFRGPPSYEIGTSFWFSFSTMVFAQREKVVSNLARFVVIIWIFVVLILTQSYTASLTSLLTVQKLQPTVTDVKQLIARKENVGYIDGSFVHGILKDLGFEENQLKIYKSPEHCDELFSRKKGDGGIAAAFDELPYLKVLLTKYCSKYTKVEPTFKTGGFGFVFPKGSPLVADVSRAILTVTENQTMKQIEDKWFGKQTSCPDPNTQVSSNSLGLESFWGLFLIVGVTSLFALLVYVSMFLYEQRHVLLHFDAQAPMWRRVCIVFRIFDQKDSSSHTFKKSNNREKRDNEAIESARDGDHDHDHHDYHGVVEAFESLSHTNGQPSVSSYSNRTDESALAFSSEEQETGFTPQRTPNEAYCVNELADENNGEIISRTP